MIAKGYAHRMPHKPSSNRLDSGPQIFRKSFEFHPNGNATHPTIMLIAASKKNQKRKTHLNNNNNDGAGAEAANRMLYVFWKYLNQFVCFAHNTHTPRAFQA